MKDSKPILLVEDDTVDAMTIERAFKELKITNTVIHVANGEEAINYLKDKNNKKPGVIFLDLNMPKMNGLEFLKIAKADKTLKKIPVIVMTISKQEQDIATSFNLGVAGYVVKTAGYEEVLKGLKTIDTYWTFSELPPD
jgi:CheY-like chemotaxis protein